jgi:DNA-binding NtrC family response regulator
MEINKEKKKRYNFGNILNALRMENGCITSSAKILNMSYQNLSGRLKNAGLRQKKSNGVIYFDSTM